MRAADQYDSLVTFGDISLGDYIGPIVNVNGLPLKYTDTMYRGSFYYVIYNRFGSECVPELGAGNVTFTVSDWAYDPACLDEIDCGGDLQSCTAAVEHVVDHYVIMGPLPSTSSPHLTQNYTGIYTVVGDWYVLFLFLLGLPFCSNWQGGGTR